MMSFQYIVVLWSAFVTGTLAGRSDRQVVGIYGGHEIPIETVPIQVSFQYRHRHECGGVIIATHWVLTAAHCIEEDDHDNHDIRAGSPHNQIGGSTHKIADFIIHKDYKPRYKAPGLNDIALLRVKKPFSIDATRQIAKLFEAGEEPTVGQMATVSGWGCTEKRIYPKWLRSVNVPIMAQPRCKNYFPTLAKGHLCAGLDKGGKDACRCDSGGPLTINNRVVAIVIWGKGCGRPKNPGVYSEIAYYRKWIKEKSGV